ncbi:MAG: hypothetical protein ACK55O_12960 [Phycisphaerales bacterium]
MIEVQDAPEPGHKPDDRGDHENTIEDQRTPKQARTESNPLAVPQGSEAQQDSAQRILHGQAALGALTLKRQADEAVRAPDAELGLGHSIDRY